MAKNNKSTSKKNNVLKEEILSKNETEKKEERTIKPKNYLILLLIFLLTLGIVIGLRAWYNAYRTYELKTSVLKDKLTEVALTELDTYIAENTDAIIYIEVTEDENSREVASDLVDVIKKRELTGEVVYLSLSSVDDKNSFFDEFNKKYASNIKIENYPALVIFKDGKIEALVSRTSKQNLNIGDIEQLFDEYELEGE